MELLESTNKSVLLVLSAVGIGLSGVMFNTYQNDTQRIQELYSTITQQNGKMLLAQQASEFKFERLTIRIEARSKMMDELKDDQDALSARVTKLEFLWKLNNVKKLIASDIENTASNSKMEASDISRIVDYLQ